MPLSLSEQLLRRKADLATQHFSEGGDPESFQKLWSRVEALELASLALSPAVEEKPRGRMSIEERTALRLKIGNEAYTRMVQEEK